MAAIANYLISALLNGTLRATNYTAPTTVYVALYTVAPTASTSGTEVTGGAYARQSVAFNAPSGGTVVNSADVTYPTATANWGTIVSFALLDASSGGNMLYFGDVSPSQAVVTNNVVKFPASQLSVGLS